MSKKIFVLFLGSIGLVVFLTLSYFSLMYFYTLLQVADIWAKNEIFEQMEWQVRTATRVEDAVGSMRYALFYYPGDSAYQISGSECEHLLETLRRNSVHRMVATLKKRFPESNQGNSPIAWIEAYYDRNIRSSMLGDARNKEWYEKWFGVPPEWLQD